MKKSSCNCYQKAFTLIELMVVMTILGIMLLSSYIPYSHHQKKVLLQQGVREFSQALRDTRSLAINGLNTGSGNVNTAIFVASGANTMEVYTSPYGLDLTLANIGAASLYKTHHLPTGIELVDINARSQDTLFSFEAISGSGSIEPDYTSTELDIKLSFKGSSHSVLQKSIRYYTQSYMSDY